MGACSSNSSLVATPRKECGVKRAFTIIAMLAFVGTGDSHAFVPLLVNCYSPRAQFTEKVPLDIAISVPDEAEMISTQLQTDLIERFPGSAA